MGEVVQDKKANMKGKFVVIIGLFLAILLTLGYFALRWYQDYSTFVSTEDARVASDNLQVSFKISGKVQNVYVKQGDTVNKGQELANLDKSDLEVALKQAKTNYDMAKVRYTQAEEAMHIQTVSASTQTKQAYLSLEIAKKKLDEAETGSRPEELSIAKAKVDVAKVSLDTAKENLARANNLFNVGAISKNELERSEDAMTIAEKNYRQVLDGLNLTQKGARNEEKEILRKQIDQAQTSLEQSSTGDEQLRIKVLDLKAARIAVTQAKNALLLAQLNYDNASIKSPVDGIIALKSINEGEYVSPGQSVFTVINPENTWIQANIKETDIAKVKVGSKVYVSIDSYEGLKVTGMVSEIGVATNSNFSILPTGNSSGNFTKVVQNIPIKIKLDNHNKAFQVGTSVEVKIRIK